MFPDLFSPIKLGPYDLPNRIVMAPLTRSRAGNGNVPHALNALYYAQRASAGLIIAEATQIAPEGQGYISTPGIHSEDQVEGWKQVTSAVHATGGRIFLQLWHVARISHQSFQPNGQLPVAPSAIRPKGQAYTANGFEDHPTPRALETDEIPGIIEAYRRGARNAAIAESRADLIASGKPFIANPDLVTRLIRCSACAIESGDVVRRRGARIYRLSTVEHGRACYARAMLGLRRRFKCEETQ
ncbi:MAG: hypothetical protein ACRERU_02670 [Methylococcales bacterium]